MVEAGQLVEDVGFPPKGDGSHGGGGWRFKLGMTSHHSAGGLSDQVFWISSLTEDPRLEWLPLNLKTGSLKQTLEKLLNLKSKYSTRKACPTTLEHSSASRFPLAPEGP